MSKNPLAIVLLSGIILNTLAVPPFFWYQAVGLDDYSGRGCNYGNLNVAASYNDFNRAVNDLTGKYPGIFNGVSVSARGFNNAMNPVDLIGPGASVNTADFTVLLLHGYASGPSLGCRAQDHYDFNSINFGGSGYLKWLYAISCCWFEYNNSPYSIDYGEYGIGKYSGDPIYTSMRGLQWVLDPTRNWYTIPGYMT